MFIIHVMSLVITLSLVCHVTCIGMSCDLPATVSHVLQSQMWILCVCVCVCVCTFTNKCTCIILIKDERHR